METQIERLSYVAHQVYEQKTGREKLPRVAGRTLPALKGEFSPDEATYKERLPRLAAKFGVRSD